MCNNADASRGMQAVYCASKYFVEALSEGTRREVRAIIKTIFNKVP